MGDKTMSETKLTVTTKKPDGTTQVYEYTDPIATMIERVLAGQEPQSRIEAVITKHGTGGGSSGGGSGSGGNDNQEFFTDDEIEDMWNSINKP